MTYETISFTGHRPGKLGNDYTYQKPLCRAIAVELKVGVFQKYRPKRAITGGALGLDTIAALMAMAENVLLTVALPFKGQERVWSNYNQEQYHTILAFADEIIICDQKNMAITYEEYLELPEGNYSAWKMQKRNVYMVDEGDLLCGLWDGSEGGTANCWRYAESVKKPRHRIDPNVLRTQL